jgi:hypothetical protein
VRNEIAELERAIHEAEATIAQGEREVKSASELEGADAREQEAAERVAELLRRGAEIGGLNRVLLQKDVREFADMHNVIADECDGDETKVCRVEGARLRRPLEEGGCACM